MSYTPHTAAEIRTMLERIGVESLAELFDAIPASLRANAELKLPQPLGERALLEHMRERAGQNTAATQAASFLGAGAYHHFIPAAVAALASRGEFSTAYTPYQAEISQGTLQAIFEFQTLVCQLTGLEVSNASLYDGASATAEAVLMAMRVTRRSRIYASAGLHPRYLDVVRTYTRGIAAQVELLPIDSTGRTAPSALPEDAAAVVIQSPNFFGCIEDLAAHSEAARQAGALSIAAIAEPLSLAVIRPPGASGVDVACGEAQSFGLPLSYGGPYLGFMAARQKLVRQLPGRLIGQTVDSAGRRAFVMTLTTREQHIRRGRATSNICTNQGLCALRATIYLALLGRSGLRKLAQINLSLASYARDRLSAAGLHLPYASPVFNEFVVEVPDLQRKRALARERALRPGVALRDFDPQRSDQLLVCTTEMNTRAEIDELVEVLA